ncbi:MAG: entericidin A/B family lipoprotein [Alphaproteobacteria bacterium]|nr:entericidin A/B family lipoprotein [Alphaproteobacteria bacterium]
MLKKLNIFILTVLAIAGLTLSACETIEGAGQDIENAGHSIQDAAN